MATAMVAGGLFNAIAFAGAGYLFQTFNKSGFADEAKRHNLANEKLQQAKEKFFESEVRVKDKQRELQNEIREANINMQDTSKAFSELRNLKKLTPLKEPQLGDFYQPSEEMEKYQIIAVTLSGTGLGWALFKWFPTFL